MARMNSSNAFGMKKKKGESKFGNSLLAAASKMETQKSDAKKKEEENNQDTTMVKKSNPKKKKEQMQKKERKKSEKRKKKNKKIKNKITNSAEHHLFKNVSLSQMALTQSIPSPLTVLEQLARGQLPTVTENNTAVEIAAANKTSKEYNCQSNQWCVQKLKKLKMCANCVTITL